MSDSVDIVVASLNPDQRALVLDFVFGLLDAAKTDHQSAAEVARPWTDLLMALQDDLIAGGVAWELKLLRQIDPDLPPRWYVAEAHWGDRVIPDATTSGPDDPPDDGLLACPG